MAKDRQEKEAARQEAEIQRAQGVRPAGERMVLQLGACRPGRGFWNSLLGAPRAEETQVEMSFRWCPPGTFLMGSPECEAGRFHNEGPQTTVTLTKGFWMGEAPVTQSQYEAVIDGNPSDFRGDGTLPVERVSWDEAMAFCQALSKKSGKQVGLPTEAQWEYACRAGMTTPFHFGATISTDQANYNGNQTNDSGRTGVYRQKTTPVGNFPANAWGLKDMHGNVWEWCQDWYGAYPGATVADHVGCNCGPNRVIRGGGWGGSSARLRSACRFGITPDSRSCDLGFRVALAVQ